MGAYRHSHAAPVAISLTLLCALAAARGAAELRALAAAGASDRIAGVERAARLSPLDWRYPLELGELKQALGRHSEAQLYFRSALDRFPSCASCWAGLAETQIAMRQPAEESLARAVRFGRSMPAVRTRTAVLYAKLGARERAAEEFSAALGGERDERPGFYEMLHRIFTNEEILTEIVTTDDLDSYMNFALGNLPVEETMLVWQSLERAGKGDPWRKPFGGYLARNGRVEEGWEITFGNEQVGPPGLLNPGFGYGTRPVGFFGWHIGDAPGVKASLTPCHDCEKGGRALRVRFDGEHNPHYFGVSQAVPVREGALYRISARIRHEDLTSARGPQIGVIGVGAGRSDTPCQFAAFGENLLGTSHWRETAFEFRIPRGCAGVNVLLSRRRTPKLDRYVGGQIWIDSVDLELLALGAEESGDNASAFSGSGFES